MEQPVQLELVHSTPAPAPSHIADVSIPGGAHAARYLLAGMLRELNNSEDARWVCWVAGTPVKPLLGSAPKQSGEHILQVVCNGDRLAVAERALRSGRSHTVVVLIDEELASSQREQLERAAAEGDADCLLVTVH